MTSTETAIEHRAGEAYALAQDAADPLAPYRSEFAIPTRPDGSEKLYFCGNSLGLQPKREASLIHQELEDWAQLAVDAHFDGRTPWFSYHEVFRECGARLVGAMPGEVVMMNSLTCLLYTSPSPRDPE